MANEFRYYGMTTGGSPSANGPYSIVGPQGSAQENDLAELGGDRSYQVGDTIGFSVHGSDSSDDYVLRGFDELQDGTRYPVMENANTGQFVILYGDSPPSGMSAGDTYTPNFVFSAGGWRFGNPVVFDNGAIEDDSSRVTFRPQGREFEIATDDDTPRTYAVGDKVDLRQVAYFTGTDSIREVVLIEDAELLGFYSGPEGTNRPSAGAPVFEPPASFNGGRRLILTDVDHPAYLVQDSEITAASWTTCFAPGTLIATPHGERAVEELGPGDMVSTAAGGIAPVKFVGMQKVQTMFGPRELTRPVRIKAGALGDGAPHSDLVVTKDHGMIVDGVICHAGALINGTGIVEVPGAELDKVATYYHVETEGHVQLLANGAAAESFLDNADRALFANHADFVAMHGTDAPPMAEMDMPRAMSARQVPRATRERLAARGEALVAPSAPAARGFLRRLLDGLRGMARPAGRRAA